MEDEPLAEEVWEAVGDLIEAKAFIAEHGLAVWMQLNGEPDPWMLEGLAALDAAAQEVWREARRREAGKVTHGPETAQHHRRGG